MTHEQQVEAIENIADIVNGTVSSNYSGRGMFGKTCYGVVCEDAIACIEEASAHGIRGAKRDSLGMQFIVYWPEIEGSQN